MLYVTNIDRNSISIIDPQTNNITDNIENVGITPAWITFSPKNNFIYVSLYNDLKVVPINTTSKEILNSIQVGNSPLGMDINPKNNQLYVANFGSDDVSVIDTITNNVTDTIENVGNGPTDLEFVPDNNFLYVVNNQNNSVWYTKIKSDPCDDAGSGSATTSDDIIIGTSGNDNINSLAGNDQVYGCGGDDRINGGPGNDLLLGGEGKDNIQGTQGNDELFQNNEENTSDGSSDTLNCGGQQDKAYATEEDNVLNNCEDIIRK
jgi:YVTN family beta-propeller protein